MSLIPDKYLVNPPNMEIYNKDIVLRRVHKRQQVDEEGNVRLSAFLLRKKLTKTGKPEKQISVVVDKIDRPALDRKNIYCKLNVGDVRKILVGVSHSPSDDIGKNCHGSLCGRFDEDKALALSILAKTI